MRVRCGPEALGRKANYKYKSDATSDDRTGERHEPQEDLGAIPLLKGERCER